MKPITPFSYERPTPKGYECYHCHVENVRLWREWNTFLSHQLLLCEKCVRKDRPEEIERGLKFEREHKIPPTYTQLGGMCAAIPTEDGETFWGYTSVPEPGVRWWHSLPTNYTVPTKEESGDHG